jgi:hypothetical protein
MFLDSMDTADFRDLVERNAYKPNIRWISHKKAYAFSPPHTCTLLVGAWLPMVKSDSDLGQTVHKDHVGAYLVPTPQIPAETIYRGRHVFHRSWKALLRMLIGDRVVRPSPEVQRLFGDEWHDVRRSMRHIGCW